MAVYCPGWASSSVWDWSGMDDETPLYSSVVDKQLATIQANIEDFHATHRTSTYDTDRIIDGQRDAVYNVAKVLTEGQQPLLPTRLFKYIEWIVDDVRARARGRTLPRRRLGHRRSPRRSAPRVCQPTRPVAQRIRPRDERVSAFPAGCRRRGH